MRRSRTLLLLVAAVAAACGGSRSDRPEAAEPRIHVDRGSSIGAKLAAIDQGSPDVPRSLVEEYEERIGRVGRRCVVSTPILAATVSREVRGLRDDGVETSMLAYLRTMDSLTAMPPSGWQAESGCDPLYDRAAATLRTAAVSADSTS